MRCLKANIFRISVVFALLTVMLFAKDPGINAFYKGDFKKAEDYYDARLNKDKENEKIMYNSGTAALAQQDLEKANSLLMQSLASEDETQLAKAHYNLGQIALQQQKTDEALAHFMKSMIYDPNDPNAKIMYEQIRQMQQQQQQQQQQQNQDQGQDREQDQDQEQQQQDQQKQENDQQQDQQQGQEQQQQRQDSQLSEEDLQAQDLTKEQAKNILNAMKEDEKESMKKLILSKAKHKKIKRSKEW